MHRYQPTTTEGLKTHFSERDQRGNPGTLFMGTEASLKLAFPDLAEFLTEACARMQSPRFSASEHKEHFVANDGIVTPVAIHLWPSLDAPFEVWCLFVGQ